MQGDEPTGRLGLTFDVNRLPVDVFIGDNVKVILSKRANHGRNCFRMTIEAPKNLNITRSNMKKVQDVANED